MKTQLLKRVMIIVTVLVAVISLLWFIRTQLREKTPEGLIVASGRIEGREVTISPKIQGRLKALLVDESDTEKKGQLLSEIVSDRLDARYFNAKGNVSLLKAQIEHAHADLSFTEKNTIASINAAEAGLNADRARLDKTKSVMGAAKNDYERYASLFEEQLVWASVYDNAKMNYEPSLADVNAAEKELKRAKETGLKKGDRFLGTNSGDGYSYMTDSEIVSAEGFGCLLLIFAQIHLMLQRKRFREKGIEISIKEGIKWTASWYRIHQRL